MKSIQYTFYLLAFALFACTKPQEQRFHLLSAQKTGVHFQNTLTPNDTFNIIKFRYFYNGGGAAVGDVNNDGLPDIYFTGNMVSSRLLRKPGEQREYPFRICPDTICRHYRSGKCCYRPLGYRSGYG